MSSFDNAKLLEFLELVGRLKHVKRTGWVLKDIPNCESIAGHMYRMGMMTFLIKDSDNLDRFKCLQIALVHDLAESIVGDLTPHCGVSPEEKHKREYEAMQTIAELTGPSGSMLSNLFMEYETQSSPEAKFVKELDRFDMVLQAFEYEKVNRAPQHLQEFFTATEGKFENPLILGLLTELNKNRNNFNNSLNGNL